MLFRSFKANFGIDIKAESGDPVKDFLNKFEQGECEPDLVDIVIWYHQSENFESFATRYPLALRRFWYRMCEQAEQK